MSANLASQQGPQQLYSGGTRTPPPSHAKSLLGKRPVDQANGETKTATPGTASSLNKRQKSEGPSAGEWTSNGSSDGANTQVASQAQNHHRSMHVSPYDNSIGDASDLATVGGREIDFSFYTKKMIAPGIKTQSYKAKHISIGELMTVSKSESHLERNKLSEKLGRRDIQFYDLHKLHEPADEYQTLRQNNLNAEGGIYDATLYQDIEVADFNRLFVKESIIGSQFGQSLTVVINQEQDTRKTGGLLLRRTIKHDKSKILLEEQQKLRQAALNSDKVYDDDMNIQILQKQLHNLKVTYKKTSQEISRIYVAVSGQVSKIRDHLAGRTKNVVMWTHMEDLALQKPDESVEFQMLLKMKGPQEIQIRRAFLSAKAQYKQILD